MTETITTEIKRPGWRWRWLRLLNGVSRMKGSRISHRRRRGENLELNFLVILTVIVIFVFVSCADPGEVQR